LTVSIEYHTIALCIDSRLSGHVSQCASRKILKNLTIIVEST